MEFSCRELQGDLKAVEARGQPMGPRRTVLGGVPSQMNWGLRRTSAGPSFWVVFELKHLPVRALSFAQAEVLRLLQSERLAGAVPVVSRLDITTDVGFRSASRAAQVLDALSATTVSGHKMRVYFGKGSKKVETVSWYVGRRLRLRVYDSLARDAQRGIEGVGGLIRFEHQHAPKKPMQRDVYAIKENDLSQLAVAPLSAGESGQLIVGDLRALNDLLVERGGQEPRGDARAERRLGALVRAYLGGQAEWAVKRTAYDRATEMRRLGLSLHPNLPQPVDLGPLLAAVRAAWHPT